jgi:hypothetical protein
MQKLPPEKTLGVVMLKTAHAFQRFNEAMERSRVEERRQREMNRALNVARGLARPR